MSRSRIQVPQLENMVGAGKDWLRNQEIDEGDEWPEEIDETDEELSEE